MSHRSVGNEIAINLLIWIGGGKKQSYSNIIPFCSTLGTPAIQSVFFFSQHQFIAVYDTVCTNMCLLHRDQ